jgi:hypothetical protein
VSPRLEEASEDGLEATEPQKVAMNDNRVSYSVFSGRINEVSIQRTWEGLSLLNSW